MLWSQRTTRQRAVKPRAGSRVEFHRGDRRPSRRRGSGGFTQKPHSNARKGMPTKGQRTAGRRPRKGR